MRSMRSAGSGPCSAAPTFSCTWATVRKPGSGSVAGLRPQIQPSAPWTSERPVRRQLSASLGDALEPALHRAFVEEVPPWSAAAHVVGGRQRIRPVAPAQEAYRQRRATEARQPEVLRDAQRLELAAQHVELVLRGDHVMPLGHGAHDRGIRHARAVPTQLAGRHELLEYVDDGRDVLRRGKPVVDQVHVDAVGVEAAQARITRAPHIGGAEVAATHPSASARRRGCRPW
jgi:hypothetical protein